MNIKENSKAFYVTDRQNKLISKHKKDFRITTSKQVRLMIAYLFDDKDRLENFNNFVRENKGELK